MEGSHLARADKVCFNGKSLKPGRYDLQGDNRIVVRIPDDAEGGHFLSVANAAGTVGMFFEVLPSHRQVLQQPLVAVSSEINHVRTLDFPVYRRICHASKLQFPIAPVIEIRNPLSTDSYSQPEDRVVTYSLNFQWPAHFFTVIPASVQALLRDQGLEPGQVDILCVSQNYGSVSGNPSAGRPRFWPYAWTDLKGLGATGHPMASTVEVTLRGQVPDIHFTGRGPDDWERRKRPEPLPESTEQAPGFQDDLAITGLDFRTSIAFWSVTRSGLRAAATLHLLLNDEDQEALACETAEVYNLQQLFQRIKANRILRKSPAFQPLQSLFRPVIAGYGRQVENPDPRLWTFLHNGTGLNEIQSVTVGGQPVEAFKTITDGCLQVCVPRGLIGDLVVTSEMGESAPAALIPSLIGYP